MLQEKEGAGHENEPSSSRVNQMLGAFGSVIPGANEKSSPPSRPSRPPDTPSSLDKESVGTGLWLQLGLQGDFMQQALRGCWGLLSSTQTVDLASTFVFPSNSSTVLWHAGISSRPPKGHTSTKSSGRDGQPLPQLSTKRASDPGQPDPQILEWIVGNRATLTDRSKGRLFPNPQVVGHGHRED